jgi:hypothetical protein
MARRIERIRASSGVSILGGRPRFRFLGATSVSVFGVFSDDLADGSFLSSADGDPDFVETRRVRGRKLVRAVPSFLRSFSAYSSSSSSSTAPASSSSSSSEFESLSDSSEEASADFERAEAGDDAGSGPISGSSADSMNPRS